MAEQLGKAVLELDTDDSKLDKGLDGAQKKSRSIFSGLGKAAKVAAAGGLLALGVGIADVVGDFMAGEKAAAQTEAVIKSTGGAAGVTAKDVDRLSTAIARKSGMDDDAIASGENMLLTFTNIQNKAGQGNDIFTQSTNIMADMSAAMGTDMKGQAIQLGKALNDPIKGVGALSEVGVTFTEQQKKQIKAMQESGDMAGAQGVILKELNKEFGGSAIAAGHTFGGQLMILKGMLEDAAAVIIEKMMPYLMRFTSFLIDNVPVAIAAVSSAIATVQAAFNTAAAFFQQHIETFKTVALAIGIMAAAWAAYTIATTIAAASQAALAFVMYASIAPAVLIVAAIAVVIVALIALYRHSDTARDIMTRAFETIKSVALSVFNALKAFWDQWGATIIAIFTSYWNVVKSLFKAALSLLQGDWQGAWNNLKAAASAGWELIVNIFRLAVGTVGAAAIAVGKAALEKIKEGMDNLKSGVQSKLDSGWEALTAAPGAIAGKAASIGSAIVNGIISGVGGLYGRLKSKLESDLRSVLSNLNPFSPVEHGGEIFIGRPIMEGAIAGITGAQGLLDSALNTSINAAVSGVDSTSPDVGSSIQLVQHFNETPASADPVAIGAVTSFALRNLPT